MCEPFDTGEALRSCRQHSESATGLPRWQHAGRCALFRRPEARRDPERRLYSAAIADAHRANFGRPTPAKVSANHAERSRLTISRIEAALSILWRRRRRRPWLDPSATRPRAHFAVLVEQRGTNRLLPACADELPAYDDAALVRVHEPVDAHRELSQQPRPRPSSQCMEPWTIQGCAQDFWMHLAALSYGYIRHPCRCDEIPARYRPGENAQAIPVCSFGSADKTSWARVFTGVRWAMKRGFLRLHVSGRCRNIEFQRRRGACLDVTQPRVLDGPYAWLYVMQLERSLQRRRPEQPHCHGLMNSTRHQPTDVAAIRRFGWTAEAACNVDQGRFSGGHEPYVGKSELVTSISTIEGVLRWRMRHKVRCANLLGITNTGAIIPLICICRDAASLLKPRDGSHPLDGTSWIDVTYRPL
jgi:hypothetical protein